MDCRIAAGRLFKALSREGGMDPNEIVGSFDESAFYLMAKYMVDPRNFEALQWAAKAFREIFSTFDPNAKILRIINPHVVDRKGVTINAAMKRQSRLAREYVRDDALLDAAFRRTHWLVSEAEGDYDLLTDSYLDRSAGEKVRRAYYPG